MLVIGIGNQFRHDDGAGVAVARKINTLKLPGVEVQERCGEGTDLIASWCDRALVFVIDAVSSGAQAGNVRRFELAAGQAAAPVRREPLQPSPTTDGPPARIFRGTSHTIGLGEAIELGKVLGQLPSRLVIYGIEGAEFSDGVGLSAQVERAATDVVARITTECALVQAQ